MAFGYNTWGSSWSPMGHNVWGASWGRGAIGGAGDDYDDDKYLAELMKKRREDQEFEELLVITE